MDIDQLLISAEQNLAQGKLDSASRSCDLILNVAPNHPRVLRILASIRYQTGHADEAAELLERAISTSPDFAGAYIDYATIQLFENRVPEAIELLQKSIELEPDNVEALVNLGNALHRLGRIADAEHHYRLALTVRPEHARGLTSLGNLLRMTRRNEEAIKCFRSALAQAPQAALIHNFLGIAYRDTGRHEEAIECFKRALELQPDLSEANFSLGEAARNKGDFSAAIESYKKADTPLARSLILECLLNERNYDELFSTLEIDSRIDTRNLHTAAVSAYACQQLERPDPYPFCPEPMSFVRVIENPAGIKEQENFLTEVIDASMAVESVWEPRGISTIKGYQTAMTLLDTSSGPLNRLRLLIESEVTAYKKELVSSKAGLIRSWPEKIELHGWFVRLLPGGHQTAHNHPDGWLSGVIYLRLPVTNTPPEGSIEFSLRNTNYPDISGEHPKMVHHPAPGHLVLFPSSLYHRTIPFHGDGERLCIAFDIAPK